MNSSRSKNDVLVYVVTIIAYVLGLISSVLFTVGFQTAGISGGIVTSFFSTYFPMCIFPIVIYEKCLKRPEVKYQTKSKLNIKMFVFWLIITIGAVQIVAQITQLFVSHLLEMADMNDNNAVETIVTNANMNTYILVGIIGPTLEEITFRKVLLTRIAYKGRGYAVFTSALAFSFFHLNIYQVFYAFVLGMILAEIAFQTHSIKQTTLIHVAVNSISLFTSFFHDSIIETCLTYLVCFSCFFTMIAIVRWVIKARWGQTCTCGYEKFAFLTPYMWLFICLELFLSFGISIVF